MHTQSKYVEYKTFSDTSKNEVSVHTKHCRHSILSDEDHINQRPELITIQVNSRRTTTNIIDGFIKTLEVYQVLVGPKALKVTR